MAKRFIYNVNGTEFEDTEAFGNAWKQAVALAKEEHAMITRAVIGVDVRYDFYTTAGVFLSDRFFDEYKENNRVKFF